MKMKVVQMSLCSVVVAIVCVSAVFAGPLEQELLHRQARQLAPSSQCYLSDGRRISDGANFTMLESGPCVYFKCHNGSVLPLDYGCLRDGACSPLGSAFTLAGCIERTCQLTHGHFDFVLTKEACTARDQRTCIDVGTTYKDGCFDYYCEKIQNSETSVTYHLKQVGAGCEYNGQCVPLNHTLSQGCRTVQCQQRFGAIGFFTVSNGCEINGKCVEVGESIVDDCRTLTCTSEDVNGLTLLNIKPTKIQCKDHFNACHDAGTYFYMEYHRGLYNCTCTFDALIHVDYQCLGSLGPPEVP